METTIVKTIKVYNYWIPHGGHDHRQVSTSKTTLEAIQNDLGCTPLLGTVQEVPVDELDADGHYQRRATGWGALD
jgi:hypothetical protein